MFFPSPSQSAACISAGPLPINTTKLSKIFIERHWQKNGAFSFSDARLMAMKVPLSRLPFWPMIFLLWDSTATLYAWQQGS